MRDRWYLTDRIDAGPVHPRRCTRWWLAATVSLVVVCAAVGDRVALAQPRLPAQIEDLLNQVGLTPQSGQRLLFGDLRPPFPVKVVKDPALVALMERARREDVVAAPTHEAFSDDNIAAGLWQSNFFLGNYGTALFLAEPYAEDRLPVVLVHGINGSPRDFADMLSQFARPPYQAVAFYYPSGMPLTDAARQLGTRLQEFLSRHQATHFGVVGHSMGGLVAKGMLDQFDADKTLSGCQLFVSIASPWAGVDAAQYAGRVPHHPASWDDIAPNSAFMQTIQKTPFPDGLRFYLFFGARSDNRLLSALGNNDGVLTLASVLGSPVRAEARDVFGFYEDHTSILSAPLVMRRLETVLDAELGSERGG